jgi:hypothetical protein
VAAEDHRPCRPAAQARPQVSRLVDVDLDRQLGQALAEPGAGAGPRVRPREPLGAALVAGQLAQRAQVGDGAYGIERRGHRSAEHNRARRRSAAPREPRPMPGRSRPGRPLSTTRRRPAMAKDTTTKRTTARVAAAPKRLTRRRAAAAPAPITHEQIALRAYEIHLEGTDGDALAHWLRAERELVGA